MCTMLKRDPRYEQIPIIMLTARSQETDRQEGLQCGADAYLVKPTTVPLFRYSFLTTISRIMSCS